MRSRLSVLLVLSLVCLSGSYAATVTVPVGSSLQTAINAANSGDVIQLQTGTYTEDILIKGGTGAKTNLTIEAAEGQSPVIEAANTAAPTYPARGLLGLLTQFLAQLLGGGTEPDQHGFIIEGNGTTLRNLTIRNNTIIGDDVFGESAVILLMADNVTIQNCVIEAAAEASSTRGIYIWTGNLTAFEALEAVPDGLLTTNGGYPGSITSANLQISNTTLRRGETMVDTVDPVTYLSILFAEFGLAPAGTYIAPINPTGTWTNVELDGGSLPPDYDNEMGEMGPGNFDYVDCYFHSHRGNYRLGGGTSTFTGCKFSQALRDDHIDFNADLGDGGGVITATFNECIFCGGTDSGRLVHVTEGTGTFNACIFDITYTGDVNTYAAIQYQPGDIEGDWYLGIPGLTPPTQTSCIIDNCDIYNPVGVGILGNDAPVDPEPPASLLVTDSIIVANQAITLPNASAVAQVANVHHNDLMSTAVPAIANAGTWTLTENNNLSVDPGYAAPGCDPAGFLYSNATLLTAGIDGGPLGSQAEPTAVRNWSLY